MARPVEQACRRWNMRYDGFRMLQTFYGLVSAAAGRFRYLAWLIRFRSFLPH